MDIVFGWHLDGPTFPETADGAAFSIDSDVVGPLGILGLLETRLGTNARNASAVLRIAQYLARLRAVDDGDRFFSESRAADEWSTARLVLHLRDGLVAAGWSPQAAAWKSPRLETMALAEAQTELPLSPGLADRATTLAGPVANAKLIDRLTLADAPEHLPFVWRRLIDALAGAGTEIVRPDALPHARAQDLARVQAALSGAAPEPLAGDGSFSVVRADNELVAADIAAEWLAARDENQDVVIIRQGDGTILDAACRRLGLPQPGGSGDSPFRGALQVLPLAFETAWAPLDAARLLEFLVMPGSPVPHRVGLYFADVLRSYPGSGEKHWREAWKKAEERWRDHLAEDGGADEDGDSETGDSRDSDAEAAAPEAGAESEAGKDGGEAAPDAEIEKKLERALADWREWLEPQRFARGDGIAAHAADAICRKIQRWAIRRAKGSDDSTYMRAADMAGDLAQTISVSGIDPIPKPQLDRMIDAVIAGGAARPGAAAEAAAWTGVDDAAQVWGPAPAILWWGFSDPGLIRSWLPWNGEERAELEAAQTVLPAPGDEIAMHLAAQRRAVLNARERALLVMPTMSAGEVSATHPIWHELDRLEGRDRVTVEGRDLRCAGDAVLCGREWAPPLVELRERPGPRRNWGVPAGLIAPRERESATSLEALLGCPMRSVLQYQAGIRESALLDMADGNRLKGNVSHEVLARLLSGDPPPADEAEIRDAAGRLLDELLPAIGSPMLLPGRARDRDDLRRNTVESAVQLFKILRESGLRVAATERRSEVRLDDRTTLRGIIDVEAADDDGHPAIIDLKWSNSDKYRREEIENERPIQLAAYARLVKDDDDPAPAPAAYFMLKQRRLLAVNAEPFPATSRIVGKDLAAVWEAILATRERLLGDLEEGRVAATGVPDTDPPADTDPQAGNFIAVEPPCRFCSYKRLCGAWEYS